MNNIYNYSDCYLECTCVDITQRKWDELMKGATRADRKQVIKAALKAGVIPNKEEARKEIKRPYYNPYKHFKTKTHLVYVHSAIEHFIRIIF